MPRVKVDSRHLADRKKETTDNRHNEEGIKRQELGGRIQTRDKIEEKNRSRKEYVKLLVAEKMF